METHYLKKELYALVQKDSSIFEFLQSGSLDGIWYWDLENQENEWMSSRFWTILGYDPKEKKHLSSEWQDLIHPEDFQLAIENFKKHCEYPNHPYDQVVRYCHKNGSTVWVRCRGIAIRNNQGKPVRMLGAHTNLTSQKKIEETLRDSEEKYKFLAEHSADVIYKINLETEQYTYVSPAIERILGYTVKEGLLLRAQDTVTAESYAKQQDELIEAITSNCMDPKIMELEAVHKDGHTLPVEIHANFILDNQGNPVEILGAVRDITERKQVEEKLIQMVQEWQTTFDTTNDAIWVLDQDHRIIRSNKKADQLFQQSGVKLIGKHCCEIVHGTEQPIPECPNMRAKHSLCRESMEWQIGKSWFQVTVDPILDACDRYAGAVHIMTDITERKQAKEALQESEAKFRNLVESIDEVIYTVDTSGEITYVSPAIESIGGYEPQEIIGRSFSDFVYQEDLLHLVDQFQKILSGHLKSNEYRFIAKSGEIYWIRASSRPIYEEGRVVGLRGVMMDITESKQLQTQLQQLQKMESIGTMAGGIAHDFNNLLYIILGNISLMEDHLQSDNKAINNLKQAEKACLRAKELTKELITFSKGGAPVKEIASINDLVKDIVISAFSESLIEPKFFIPDNLRQAEIDISQIKQVVDNITVNAREAMHNKGAFKVYCENVDIQEESILTLTKGEYIKISFIDQGSGISKENLNKIFEPYFSTKDMGVNKGQGLGLAICYSIITRHNGLISVESESGAGATFSIYLPASISVKEPDFQKVEILPEVQEPVKRPASGKSKILIMDDEEMIRSFMDKMLSRSGYDVETCIEGKEAIEIYKKAMESKGPFDVVILDLSNQFGMGGQETMRRLLEIDHRVKGIVFTGYSNDPVVSNYRTHGFSGFLTKPATKDELNKVINEVISNNQ